MVDLRVLHRFREGAHGFDALIDRVPVEAPGLKDVVAETHGNPHLPEGTDAARLLRLHDQQAHGFLGGVVAR